MEWNFQTAEELAAALRAGEVTSVELTDEAIARIERDDKVINAICVPDFDRARAAARGADQARARGEDRPLLGIPVTVKESYNIAGLPTTWGMPQHRDYLPAEDAVQVSRLKAAGAVVLGKTNVPLGLQDIQSFNEIYGTTNNPWDHDRTSGGSSGGSAAALACRIRRAVHRLRPRRFAAHPRAFLRRLRAQADTRTGGDPRHGRAARAGIAGRPRPRRRRSDGAHRPRPHAPARRHGRTGPADARRGARRDAAARAPRAARATSGSWSSTSIRSFRPGPLCGRA